MQIREFQESDESAVVDLWRQCGLTVPANDPRKDIARKLLVDRDLFLVGVVGVGDNPLQPEGHVVASVMGGYEGHRGWVNYLAVAEGYRTQGHGRALMEEIEQRLKNKGAPKINLQVRATNQSVIDFYASIGYKLDNVVSFGKRLVED